MEVHNEIITMRKESAKIRNAELRENYSRLSPDSQIELVMFSRKLVEKENEAKQINRFIKAYEQLNDDGKKLIWEYVQALLQDPRYRKVQ